MNTFSPVSTLSSTAKNAAGQFTPPFASIKFMRLIVWKESELVPTVANSGQTKKLLQRYALPFIKGVTMDFCHSKSAMPANAGAQLKNILSQCRILDEDELFSIEEALNYHCRSPLTADTTINHAQIGSLNGKQSLAIEWINPATQTQHISVYISNTHSSDTMGEVHLSAPSDSFQMAKKYFSEVLRSLQWHDSVRYEEVA